MKKSPSLFCRIGFVMAAMCFFFSIGAGLASCARTDTSSIDTVAPTEELTVPDLTDNRTFTDLTVYDERISAAFATSPVTSEDDLSYTVGDDGVTVNGYTGADLVVVLPDTIEGKPVVRIAEDAFADHGNLRALSIPDSVLAIGFGALKGCNSLSTLRTPLISSEGEDHFGSLFGAETYEINASRVPATLSTLIVTTGESIPDYAFYDCNMSVISLPQSIQSIGRFSFYGNEKLAYIPLGHTALKTVGEWAFTNCSSLLSLEIPATAETMGFAMLEGCGKLESLTLPFIGTARNEAVSSEDDAEGTPINTDYIGYLFGAADYTFTAGYIPASLIRVTLQEGCGEVPANAFFECASVREVVLPDGVMCIGRRAFYGCTKLSKIAIPDSVHTIDDDAFHGCTRLVDLTVGEGVSTLGVQVFMDCRSLVSVTLPASVTYLPNATFANCISLETLNAPGVTDKGAEVFRHCDRYIATTVID